MSTSTVFCSHCHNLDVFLVERNRLPILCFIIVLIFIKAFSNRIASISVVLGLVPLVVHFSRLRLLLIMEPLIAVDSCLVAHMRQFTTDWCCFKLLASKRVAHLNILIFKCDFALNVNWLDLRLGRALILHSSRLIHLRDEIAQIVLILVLEGLVHLGRLALQLNVGRIAVRPSVGPTSSHVCPGSRVVARLRGMAAFDPDLGRPEVA